MSGSCRERCVTGADCSAADAGFIVAGPTAPNPPQVTPNPVCPSARMVLSTSGGSGGTPVWYANGCGLGEPVGTGYEVNIPAPCVSTSYFVRIEGACGASACSGPIQVTVNPVAPPTQVSASPDPVCVGAPLQLCAAGGTCGTYTWYRNACGTGQPIGTGACLDIPAPSTLNVYYVRVEQGCGVSACGVVVVDPLVPAAVSIEPNVVSAPVHGQRTIQATVTAGDPPLAFQWFFNNEPILQANAASLTIAGIEFEDAGVYRVEVSNTCNPPASDSFNLTVWLRGDMDCDGDVDFFDIDYFVAAISGESAWKALYVQRHGGAFPPCPYDSADCSLDSFVNFFDIDPFVEEIGADPEALGL